MTAPAVNPALPHDQRLRLIRSTRKVGSILGETPMSTEVVEFPSTQRPRGLSRSNSTPSLRRPRPVLLVRLTTTDTASAPHSPTSAPGSPVWPTTPVLAAQEDAARRVKMAKLSQTFGQNVPHALVFPLDRDRGLTPQRPRRVSSLPSFERISVRPGSLRDDEAGAPLTGSLGARSDEVNLLSADLDSSFGLVSGPPT
ncbi:hypothetical protein C8R46DRAFT_1082067 [Mycena filopes]|nr:hypothetical protein C8R46DRAFT_1082067 [Mycena filopes]